VDAIALHQPPFPSEFFCVSETIFSSALPYSTSFDFDSDFQPSESDLLPGFGVGRARELLLWLVNLELRLPPYTEASPA